MEEILLIPGYNHDPEVEKHSPYREPEGHFCIWQKNVLKDMPTKPFPWFSAVQRRDLLKAWAAGYLDTYKWAYGALAVKAANRLVAEGHDGNILCHSLGTRVALLAIKKGLKPKKVLMLNGAEHVDLALPIMETHPEIEFLNVAVKGDRVLSFLGSWFSPRWFKAPTIGNGLKKRPSNVSQVILDDPKTKARFKYMRGWDLRGDNPDSLGDHSFSFKWPGNWELIRAFFTQ